MSPRAQIIAFLVLLGFAALFLSASPRTAQRLQAGVFQLLAPFAAHGTDLQKQITAMTQGLKSLESLEKENQELKSQVARLRAENQILKDIERENDRLRTALEFRRRSSFKLIPARIVARDASLFWSTALIDRGSDHGVEPQMPVLSEEGLVGKTVNTSKTTASILLVSDESCKVAAIVEGTQEQGIVSGARNTDKNNPVLHLDYLSKQADLKPGQKVYSSGAGGVFPYGILIGTIKSLTVRDLDARAEVIPAASLGSLDHVFIANTSEREQ